MSFINKTLNSIRTNLITQGDPFNCDGKDVIICITGNPGFIEFYTEFSEELYRSTDLPVCIIGHAGHELLPNEQSKLEGREDIFNLNGQLKHKLDLIKNHIDKNSRLHFIGHSIGSWFLIELLDNNDDLYKRTASVNLLFPTIQKMAQSEKGKFLNGFVRKIHSFLFLFSFLLYLPQLFLSFIVNMYLKINGLSPINKNRILNILNPKILEKVLFLAYDEMDTVTELNKKGFEKVKHITNIIYTKSDGWAPYEYMKDLMVYQPDLQIKEVNADHSFVLKSSESIASLAADFINTKVGNN
ncbi:lipid droplet-associated hydrolase [Papilio machaon]|uniref:lipid droplet-associated hydrolase n=1 Tax=Papilio machaon TaxID=76193 RepID=UPI001E663495|nr:lipid droplet-associated hydrolase [Papilio machaon]